MKVANGQRPSPSSAQPTYSVDFFMGELVVQIVLARRPRRDIQA